MRKFIALILTLLLSNACIAQQPAIVDSLEEVNTMRASYGLKPFLWDRHLTAAAMGTARWRAQNLSFGHLDDFYFVPDGTRADACGCAAYEASFGWLSCCMTSDYQFAGAAYVLGRDGKRYMSLAVRGGSGRELLPHLYSPSGTVGRSFFRR